MPINTESVGQSFGPVETRIDSRWLMAYAAGISDSNPAYFDTTREIAAHPMFPVCFEWPILLAARARLTSLTAEEAMRGVHASQDIVLHRQIRAGDTLRTTVVRSACRATLAGAYDQLRFETVDAAGAPVCTTWYGTLFRGVNVTGPDRQDGAQPPLDFPEAGQSPNVQVAIPIPENSAHVYTECSRIWNPVHTDLAFARRAGLPGLILHGTATLAMSISTVINRFCGSDPSRVQRLGGEFRAIVPLPSEIRVLIEKQTVAGGRTLIRFRTLNGKGEDAVRNGFVVAKTP